MADIQINQLMESTVANDGDWIAIDNGNSTKKISVGNFNATGAQSASQSASEAYLSAQAAESAKTDAIQAKDDTEALITSAQTIVSNAETYAGEASTSANTASTAANTATAQAAIATNQANLAAGYAANVDNFAKTAKSWAVGGTGTRQDEDTDNSKYYSQQAHTSEINAATSEANAATSETNAAASETNAAASESNAYTYAQNAAVSESNAADSETNAATSASNAADSESNAATSETNAAASATAAEESEDDSEAWAWGKVNGVDVPATHPAYHNNAKYWADAAGGAAGGGVTSFNGRSGIVASQSGDYDASQVALNSSVYQATNVDAGFVEVHEEIEDLDESLANVARTGSYDDLVDKPTLGSAAAKNYTDTVSSGSTDLITSGGVASGLSLKANTADLGTAAGKDFTTSVTSGSSDLVTSGAVASALSGLTPTWSNITGKPFESLGDGLSVIGGILEADVTEVSLSHFGTASASSVSFQSLDTNGSIGSGPIDGTMYMEQTIVTSTSQDVTATFTNSAITTSSAIKVWANKWGIVPSNVVTTSGQCVVTIPKQDSAFSLGIRIYIM